MSTAQVIVKTVAGRELPGSAVWRAGRWWPCGADGTIVTILENDLSALEAAILIANEARTGLADTWAPASMAALTDAQVEALNAETGGLEPYDIALSDVGPGVIQNSSQRSVIGQRALAVLQADAQLDVEVVG